VRRPNSGLMEVTPASGSHGYRETGADECSLLSWTHLVLVSALHVTCDYTPMYFILL